MQTFLKLTESEFDTANFQSSINVNPPNEKLDLSQKVSVELEWRRCKYFLNLLRPSKALEYQL